MYTVWHVGKYKIKIELVINHWTNEILVTDVCYTFRRSGSELFDTFKNITFMRIFPL